MPDAALRLTPYPDVNALLNEMNAGVQGILGESFVGMYLWGSLARGDFDPLSSDIDFVVLTADVVPDELFPAIEALHEGLIVDHPNWGVRLEGYYFPQEALGREYPAERLHPAVNEGKFYRWPRDDDWLIHLHTLREKGVAVAGPSLQTMIDPVSPDELRGVVAANLADHWTRMLVKPDRLYRKGYQPYAVLTMCRMLSTLLTGEIVSKPVAAEWALEALDERWRSLIARALELRRRGESEPPEETLEFIRFTIEQSQNLRVPGDKT
ncbi:MAG: DUF4111 domain-containing protein [Chloroflexi bacterium]|nr:DUF4111 domain-containing protein [Chloroflexota bacterium]